jgi:hypothetical protein
MEGMEQDINDALNALHSSLDGVTDSVEMLSHTRASNQRVNDLQAWVRESVDHLGAVLEQEMAARRQADVEMKVFAIHRMQKVRRRVACPRCSHCSRDRVCETSLHVTSRQLCLVLPIVSCVRLVMEGAWLGGGCDFGL